MVFLSLCSVYIIYKVKGSDTIHSAGGSDKCNVLLYCFTYHTVSGIHSVFSLKPGIHGCTEWFANQMRVCVDGSVNLRCVVDKRFAYHSPRTEICQFLARTQRELDAPSGLSMHRVSFARLRFAEN